MEPFAKTDKNKIKRLPKRGHYDRETIYKILDAGFLCHVGFVAQGQPYVIPTSYGREGDQIYLHGSSKSRMMGSLEQGIPMCMTVTHLDGLVLARSAFHHSMNYRSAILFGTAAEVHGEEKEKGLYLLSENILKGRWEEVRGPNAKELKATTVLRMTIESASAKIRTGPPGDDEEDYELAVWAGVVPLSLQPGPPEADPLTRKAVPVSASVFNLVSSGT